MVGKMNGDISHAFEAQLEGFRRSDQQRDALLHDLVRRYEELQHAYQDKCNDYEDAVQSRRKWQRDAVAAGEALVATRRQIESNHFALALIDGDGALFHDALLKAGSEGGSDAAHKLLTEIKNHVLQRHEGAGQWSIMVQIYANLDGLARKLCSIGIIKSPSELHAFTRAFSLNQPLFSFIDVGSGKERADHKIKEMFRLFIHNQQCKHIIFGGCHDNGYLNNLDPYKHDTATASRITLLETTPAEYGFTALNYALARFPTVFRSDPLPDKPIVQALKPVASPFKPATASPAPNASLMPPPQAAAPPPPPSVTSSPGLTPVQPTPSQSTWATVGKGGVVEKNINIASTGSKRATRPTVYLNSMDQRIDMPLANPGRAAVESLHERIRKQKVCNDFHLGGKCDTEHCPYSHGPAMSEAERLALRVMARSRSCPQRSYCRDTNCYYGHMCPNDECWRQDCYFRDLHRLDRVAVLKMYEDGNLEVISPA